MKEEFGGIGIEVPAGTEKVSKTNPFVIVSVFKGGTGDAAGLKENDRIEKVDNVPLNGLGQEYIVKNFCQYSNTYFSYNVNKCEGDNKVIMLTIRDKKISQEDYFKKVESITSDMKKALLPLIKVQSEFAVFDSNPEHDNPWLN